MEYIGIRLNFAECSTLGYLAYNFVKKNFQLKNLILKGVMEPSEPELAGGGGARKCAVVARCEKSD